VNAIQRRTCGKKYPVGSLCFLFHNYFAALIAALFIAGTAMGQSADRGQTLSIAASSNLIYAVDELNRAFAIFAPNVATTVSSGASGNFVTQIKHGAPYDVFLSADVDNPQALVEAGYASRETMTAFATGQLVLWTTKPGTELNSIEQSVRSNATRHLAIANPDTAPYGRAAQQTLENLGLWAEAKTKLVVGENITQAAQFVETGNADLGFIALSLVLSPKLKNRGRWIIVPARLHAPLDQAVVLTNRGATNPAGTRYLKFLRSDTARAVLTKYGYTFPAATTAK
jgi:molybdate transport system substrate-binding protein